MSQPSPRRAAPAEPFLDGRAHPAELLRVMLQCRYCDQREAVLLRQGHGWFHMSAAGHEAIASLAYLLRPADYLFPYYRDRALILARGVPLIEQAKDFYAVKASSSGGRQLPCHYSYRPLNVWSFASPVASNLLPAAGAAWGMQLDGLDAVVLATVGDGAIREGEFYESLAFAAERRLPIVYVVEDNSYSISTNTRAGNPLRLGILGGDLLRQVDGREPDGIFDAADEAVAKARAGGGPTLIWCDVDRLSSHSSVDDHRIYRGEEEVAAMSGRDPIARFEARLIAEGLLSESERDAMHAEAEAEVRAAYEEAAAMEPPGEGDSLTEVLGPEPVAEAPPVEAEAAGRMVDAVNAVFRKALQEDDRTLVFGEDVEEPMGGVFKLTVGLSHEFPGHVVNAPLAESTIAGVCCGLATYGKRPLCELPFVDFAGPAWNQIITNLATLRWRTNGRWTAPMVVYAPYGAYLPGGAIWHSQANEALFAHLPGLRVVVPATPEDAAGLMWTALHAEDPTIVLLPKHLLRLRVEPSQFAAVPFGKASVVREGTDLTLVTWGNCREVALEALERLADRASVEVVDLRTIAPWDRETVAASVRKTGRLLVVHEDNRNCGPGQMVVAELMNDPGVFASLTAPPEVIAKKDTHVGFNPAHEYGCLPSASEVAEAVQRLRSADAPVRPSLPEADAPAAGEAGAAWRALKVPQLGEGLSEARIISLLKREGDVIALDEPIYELETDKASTPVESPVAGRLREWKVSEGEMVPVGSDVCVIDLEGAGASPAETPRVTADYAEAFLTPRQSNLVRHLERSADYCVPATVSTTIGWKALERAHKTLRKQRRAVTPFLLFSWCVVKAMEHHPKFRSVLTEGHVLRTYHKTSIGLARALPNDELITAVVPNASDLSRDEYLAAARERLKHVDEQPSDDLKLATLVISYMGDFGIRDAVPVIVPPACATLFVGSANLEPVADEKGQRIERFATVSLTFDHRIANGVGAARFLTELKDMVENFDLD